MEFEIAMDGMSYVQFFPQKLMKGPFQNGVDDRFHDQDGVLIVPLAILEREWPPLYCPLVTAVIL